MLKLNLIMIKYLRIFSLLIVINNNCETFAKLQNHVMELNRDYCLCDKMIANIFDRNQTILYIIDNRIDFVSLTVPLNVNNSRYVWSLGDVINETISFNYKSYVLNISDKSFFVAITKLLNSIYWVTKLSTSGVFVIMNAKERAFDFAKYMWSIQVTKIIFLNDDCTSFTYDPFVDHHNDDRGKFAKISHVTNDYFPFMRNMKNRSVAIEILASFLPVPYIDTNANPPIGVCLNPLHLWSETYNVSLNFYTRMDRLFRKGKSKEAHWYFTDSIRAGTVDMLATYPMVIDVNINLTTTRTFLNQRHLWIVTKPKRVSNAKIFGLIFTYDVWFYIMLTTFLVGIVWYVISRIKKERNAFEIVIEIARVLFCGNTNIPQDVTLRILLLSYVIFAFLFNYTFQARYSSFLTVPQYADKVNTDEKLARSTLIPYILDAYQYQFMSWKSKYADKFLKRMMVHNEPINQADYVYNNPGYALMTLPMASSITAAKLERVETFENNIVFPNDPRYVLKVGSFYTESINRIAVVVFEGGFPHKWSTDMKKVEFIKDTVNTISLSFVHVQFAFFILIGGFSLAAILFCVELLHKYFKNIACI